MLYSPFRKTCFSGIFFVFSFSGIAAGQATIFHQGFDTTWALTSSLPGWSGTSSPANQVWHRNDITSGWSAASSGAYSPGGAGGSSFSARFHSCGAASGSTGDIITPAINCSSYGGSKKLTFYCRNGSSGSDELDVYVSYNNGSTWSGSLLKIRHTSGWTRYAVPLGATAASSLKIKFTASQGGAAGSSDIGLDEVTVSAYVQDYVQLPYYQDFEAPWSSGGSTRDVPDVYWMNTPQQGDASWRRQDDGASAAWKNSSQGIVLPAGGDYAADFHSYSAFQGHSGYLDLHVDFSPAGTKQLMFDFQNDSPGDLLEVSLSTDGGISFGAPLLAPASGSWSRQTVLLGTSSSPECVIRFKATGDEGFDDIGLDNIYVEVMEPLAVKLKSFAGRALKHGVLLEWSTASESGLKSFTLERKSEREDFTPVGHVPATGQGQYRIADYHSSGPQVYYRLRCTETNGDSSFSHVIAVAGTAPEPCRIAFREGWLSITDLPGGPGEVEVSLYDAAGHQLLSRFPASGASGALSVPVPALAKGVYVVHIRAGEALITKKVVYH